MEYQALYRKYRPKTFDNVYGQKVIVQTLKNIIKNNKLTHAYLFIGPRGTGKTSIAKIFAKTINCVNSKNGISCEQCDICNNSNLNENIDIIEMDAASNNGVDEIREIRDHVKLLPSISKYKVYIIDEVHMLTTGAFNALLKTLEEPPKHVIFILATTEPHKIPLTIISRCQSFEFKPIPKNIVNERLKYICEKEKIEIDDKSLDLISASSNGGMRDAIGLLDQLNAYSNGKIKYEDVLLLNGRISDTDIIELFEKISNKNLLEAFNIIDSIEEQGKNFVYICEDMIRILRDELITTQINPQTRKIKSIRKENIMDLILLINSSLTDLKNTQDKRIMFDILIVKIYDIINNIQTNVCNIKESKIETKEKINKSNEETKKTELTIDLKLYENLMDIRLNNILAQANKKDLIEYKQKLEDLPNQILNLDQLKIVNLLDGFEIRAASQSGIVFTSSSENLINNIYEEIIDVDEIISNILNKKIETCFLLSNKWEEKRLIYVEKIKNKEQIDKMDESKILEKIKKKTKNSDFDELLEIGG